MSAPSPPRSDDPDRGGPEKAPQKSGSSLFPPGTVGQQKKPSPPGGRCTTPGLAFLTLLRGDFGAWCCGLPTFVRKGGGAGQRFTNSLRSMVLAPSASERVSRPPNRRVAGTRAAARRDIANNRGRRTEPIISGTPVIPWRGHILLRDVVTHTTVTRSAVRDSRDSAGTDQRSWRNGTRLHVWSEGCGEKRATDFPLQEWSDDGRQLKPGEPRLIFARFCAHRAIERGEDFGWIGSPLDSEVDDQQLEGGVP